MQGHHNHTEDGARDDGARDDSARDDGTRDDGTRDDGARDDDAREHAARDAAAQDDAVHDDAQPQPQPGNGDVLPSAEAVQARAITAVAPPDPELVRRIVEAALLAAAQPLTVAQLAALFPEEAPVAPGTIERALNALAAEAPQRGVELVEVASGFRFQVRSEVQPWVARLWTERPARYTRALLETLALIAYRQPITRGEIEQIRGVAVSSNIIRTLEEREWVRVVGYRDVPGKPALLGTTRGFLDYFSLKSLDQLPPLAELREIPDLEPQLQLEPVHSEPSEGTATSEPSTEGPTEMVRPEHTA